MASPFEIVIGRLRDIGAFEFLFPFLLTSAIFYGLLRRSQVFGPPEKNVAVNATVALVAAFMVWAYPVLLGVSIEKQLAQFFFSGVVVLLTLMVGLLVSGMFFKKSLGEIIEEKFKGNMIISLLIVGAILSIGMVISSGLLNVFFPQTVVGGISEDVMLTIIVLVILAITFFGITSLGMEGGKESK